MGKLALAQYHSHRKKLRGAHVAGAARLRQPVPIQLTGRSRTRVIAALLHGIDPAVIARDQKIPRRFVVRIAIEENLRPW